MPLKKKQPEIIEYLLECGADIDELEPYDCGGTPLHMAVDESDYDMIALLLGHGANIKMPHKDGWTPICYAIHKGNTDLVKYLVKFVSDPIFKVNLVSTAIRCKENNIAKFLIQEGADINYFSRYPIDQDEEESNDNLDLDPPLFSAVGSENSDMVRYLLDNKADINVKCNSYGVTLLELAKIRENNEIIELLTKHKQSINQLKKTTIVLGQGYRDTQSFFGNSVMPQEITKKILALTVGDEISNEEQCNEIIDKFFEKNKPNLERIEEKFDDLFSINLKKKEQDFSSPDLEPPTKRAKR